MNTGKKILLLITLAAFSVFSIPAQTNTTETTSSVTKKPTPQWLKDMRRWEIVAFGSIPFTMLISTFAMDMHRWNQANGRDFSTEGRRYAPWPLKSAGAIGMDKKEQEMVFIIAGSLSVGVAMADLVIVQIKRHRARKKAAALPVGTTIITREPWHEEDEARDGIELDEAVPLPSPEQH